MAESLLPLPIDALVAPIPGSDPRGPDLWWAEIKDKFDEARKEVVTFRPGDSLMARPKVETPGRWEQIIRESQAYLTGQTKDLNLAARLVEALLKHRDPATAYQPLVGLADGLALMRRLVDEAWDRLYPAIDDGDLEVRATPFNWLDNIDRANSVPLLVRSTPLVGDFWWIDFNPGMLSEGPIDKGAEERRKAAGVVAGGAGQKHWGPVVQHLKRIQEEIRVLEESLVTRMGKDLAPTLRNIRNAIVDCLDLAHTYLPKVAEVAAAKPDEAGGSAPNSAGAPPAPSTEVTRADLYDQLADAAAKLQKIEPHSPIPYLVQRAVELGQMSFPQLMKALISDAKVLDEMNRGLGIKPEPPPPK